MQEMIQLEVNAGIASLSINRPKQLNSLNSSVLSALEEAVDRIAAQSDVKVVLVSGQGDKAFVAGADIKEMLSKTPAEGQQFSIVGQRVFSKLEALPQPVIAVINGYALGGGCELACACDIRIAADNASFGQPEVGLGITPGFGGTQRLARLVGPGRAKYLILSGEIIRAQEAYQIGLVDLLVPAEELQSKAQALAEKIAKNGTFAVAQSKQAINAGLDSGLAAGLSYEAQACGMCFSHPDQKKFMQAFVDKKK